MDQVLLHKEEENRKYGFIISMAVHAILFLILLIPCLNYLDPPPQLEGIMVVFGQENAGEPEPQIQEPNPAAATAPKKVETAKPSPKKEVAEAKFEKVQLVSKTIEDVAEVKAVKKVVETKAVKKTEKTVKKTEPVKTEPVKETPPAKSQEEIDAELNAKKYTEAKSQFGSMFNKSSSSTKGEAEGQKGDPLGKRDAKALEGISKGSGRVGGGLSNRGVLYEPKFSDNSQKSGVVVIKICVDQKGNVLSSKFTQKGSTTTDNYLVSLAEKQVKKYKFTPGDAIEQCGTITVDFKLQ